MQVTFKEIVDARESLMNLSQQWLPIKVGYNISKVIRKANTELEFLTKTRQDIISRLAPQGTEITPEVNQAIMDELNQVLNVEVEMQVNKIDLSRVPGLELSARDVMALEPFCDFEDTALE